MLYFGCETEELFIIWYLFLQTLQKYLQSETKSPLQLYFAKPNMQVWVSHINHVFQSFNVSHDLFSNLSSSCLNCMHHNRTETDRRASGSFMHKSDVNFQVLLA